MRTIIKWTGIALAGIVLVAIGSAVGGTDSGETRADRAARGGGEQAQLEQQLDRLRTDVGDAEARLGDVRGDISAARERVRKARTRAGRAERRAERIELP